MCKYHWYVYFEFDMTECFLSLILCKIKSIFFFTFCVRNVKRSTLNSYFLFSFSNLLLIFILFYFLFSCIFSYSLSSSFFLSCPVSSPVSSRWVLTCISHGSPLFVGSKEYRVNIQMHIGTLIHCVRLTVAEKI